MTAQDVSRLRALDEAEARLPDPARPATGAKKAKSGQRADQARCVALAAPWRVAPSRPPAAPDFTTIQAVPAADNTGIFSELSDAVREIEAELRSLARGGRLSTAEAGRLRRAAQDVSRVFACAPTVAAQAWARGDWSDLRRTLEADGAGDADDMFARVRGGDDAGGRNLSARLDRLMTSQAPARAAAARHAAVAEFLKGAERGIAVAGHAGETSALADACRHAQPAAIVRTMPKSSDGMGASPVAFGGTRDRAATGGAVILVVAPEDVLALDAIAPDRIGVCDGNCADAVAARCLALASATALAGRVGIVEPATGGEGTFEALAERERTHLADRDVDADGASAGSEAASPNDEIGGMFAVREIASDGSAGTPPAAGGSADDLAPLAPDRALCAIAELARAGSESTVDAGSVIAGGARIVTVATQACFVAYYLSGRVGYHGQDMMPPRLLVVERDGAGQERVVRDQARAFARLSRAVVCAGMEPQPVCIEDRDLLDRISRHMACLSHWDLRPERVARLLAELARRLSGPDAGSGEGLFGDLSLASLELLADRWMRIRTCIECGRSDALPDGVREDLLACIDALRFADRDRARGVQDRVRLIVVGSGPGA